MSDDDCELFEQLNELSRELKEDEEYYGFPYNDYNPKYNLNLVSSETMDELIQDILGILHSAVEYKSQGWELTEPVRFGKIELHYDRDTQPRQEGENHE